MATPRTTSGDATAGPTQDSQLEMPTSPSTPQPALPPSGQTAASSDVAAPLRPQIGFVAEERRRLNGMIVGNSNRPRSKLLVCGLPTGEIVPLEVPPQGPIRKVLDRIEELAPFWLDFYEDNPPARRLGGVTFATVEHTDSTRDLGPAGRRPQPPWSPVPLAKVPEQALHTIISAQAMERVYANAYGNLLPIFDKLMATANTLAEQQALRADRNEQSVQQLTQALLRQTQSFLESREQQIAERERSVEEEEGASEGNEQFGLAPILNTMVMGALSGLANRPDGVQKVHELVNRITKVISELVGAKPEEGGNSK